MSADVALIVPAAGNGTRMGGERKQFRLLGDAPLLVQTLRAFDGHPALALLVVAVPPGEEAHVEEALHAYGLETPLVVVAGGATRQASVQQGLAVLPGEIDYVLVHDAVRPFVSRSLVDRCLEAARQHGAAVPAVPVADTVRRADAGVFGETVARDGLYLVQTPQAFRRCWLDDAQAASDPAIATDDATLVQAAGYAVHLLDGERRNFKVTTPEDWTLAQALWGVPVE